MQIARSVRGKITVRAAPSAYALLVGMAGIPSWVALFSLSVPGALGFLGLGIGAMVFVAVWLSRFAIELTDDSITYRTLWRGTRSRRFKDIRRAAVEIGGVASETRSIRSRPMIRLALYPYEANQEVIDINMKVFERHGVQRILEHLGLDREDMSLARRLHGTGRTRS
jgi:hypothetical protein